MSNVPSTVTVEVVDGATITIPWKDGMTADEALEGAYNAQHNSSKFTYALQYFGTELGNLVIMINETYESFMSSAHPFYYWEFFVNGTPSPKGIDHTQLNPGDKITFELQLYNPDTHSLSTVGDKHKAKLLIGKN